MSLETNVCGARSSLGGALTFIQNQNFSLAQQCPGKANELPLPRREGRATLSDGRIKPLREAFHVLLQVGLFPSNDISMTTPHT
jgi:hypothetical protein